MSTPFGYWTVKLLIGTKRREPDHSFGSAAARRVRVLYLGWRPADGKFAPRLR